MIVPMRKIYTAVKASDRDDLLRNLRDMGVVHLAPVDVATAKPDEPTSSAIQRLSRAVQILESIEPGGEAPQMEALEAADRVLEIYSHASDMSSRMAALARQVERLGRWGDVKLETFRQLQDSGLTVKFYLVAPEEKSAIVADCMETVGIDSNGFDIVAVVYQGECDCDNLPESAQELALPERDRPTLRAEAAEIEAQLKDEADELHRLANMSGAIEAELGKYRVEAEFDVAGKGGLESADIYAVQGWVPAEKAEQLPDELNKAGIDAGIDLQQPQEGELPPTLIKYPGWASPIQALFKMLGTVPGYDEFDLSPFFMIAMPIFTGMLVGDAGYGLLMGLLPILMWKKISASAGRSAAALILIFGMVTFAWGVLTANYFGVTPIDVAAKAGFATEFASDGSVVVNGVAQMMDSGTGTMAAIGNAMAGMGIFYRVDGDAGRNLIIMISFIVGTAHLIAAQLRQAVGRAPAITALAHVGWSVFLVGMLGVVWMLFFPAASNPGIQWISAKGVVTLLAVGGALVMLFSFPSKNPFKAIIFGFVGNLLPMISTFSDTMSYIRLMAVGLASYYIAWAFNGMAMDIASAGVWAWVFAALVLVLGHGLNIFLALIAVLAHGVRLNMLEFSNNVGVQWYGYSYAPFGADSK